VSSRGARSGSWIRSSAGEVSSRLISGLYRPLALASALGHGRKFVPARVEAQEQLTGARIVPR
jgi:hypothetical protein